MDWSWGVAMATVVEKKGSAGLIQYWKDKNQLSLDGIPTDIVARNIQT